MHTIPNDTLPSTPRLCERLSLDVYGMDDVSTVVRIAKRSQQFFEILSILHLLPRFEGVHAHIKLFTTFTVMVYTNFVLAAPFQCKSAGYTYTNSTQAALLISATKRSRFPMSATRHQPTKHHKLNQNRFFTHLVLRFPLPDRICPKILHLIIRRAGNSCTGVPTNTATAYSTCTVFTNGCWFLRA